MTQSSNPSRSMVQSRGRPFMGLIPLGPYRFHISVDKWQAVHPHPLSMSPRAKV